jgi:hypothetical protein
MAFWNSNGLLIGRIAAPDKLHWLTGSKGDISALTVRVNNVFLAGKHRILLSVRDEYNVLIDQIDNIFFDVQLLLLSVGAVNQFGIVQIDSEWSAPEALTIK